MEPLEVSDPVEDALEELDPIRRTDSLELRKL